MMRVAGGWRRNSRMDGRSVLRVVNKLTNDGPVKRDILLSNVQLVDDDAPIIWHGLQRPTDGILRQALLSPEKDVKAEDGKSSSVVEESPPPSSGVVVGGLLGESPHLTSGDHLSDHDHHHRLAGGSYNTVMVTSVATSPPQQVIVVNTLVDPLSSSIIIASPSHAPSRASDMGGGERLSSPSCHFHHGGGGALPRAIRPKKKSNPLRGNPVLNPGFESPIKKKRPKKRLSLLLSSPEKEGPLVDPLLLPTDENNDVEKSPVPPHTIVPTEACRAGGVAALELGASLVEEPPMPMFAASLDRPSTPGSIQIVSADIDFPSIASKSPSKMPMKLIRMQLEANHQHHQQQHHTQVGKFNDHFLVSRLPDVDMNVDDISHEDGMLVDPATGDHHTQGHLPSTDGSEYTDHLLSQLSAGVLPAMSSSQVSSVLSALEPNVSIQNGVTLVGEVSAPSSTCVKAGRTSAVHPVSTEHPPEAPITTVAAMNVPPPQPTVFVKIESSGNNIGEAPVRRQQNALKKKSKVKYVPVECKAGRLLWFKCSGCAFVCVGREAATNHCTRVHGTVASGSSPAKAYRQPKLRCIACPNTFCSLQSVKVHMMADHDVLVPEIQEILMMTVEANKVWKAEARSKLDKASMTSKPTDSGDAVKDRVPSHDTQDDEEEESFSLFGSVESFISEATANGPESGRSPREMSEDSDIQNTSKTRVENPQRSSGDSKVSVSACSTENVACPTMTTPVVTQSSVGAAKPEPQIATPPPTTKTNHHIKLEKDNVIKCPTFGCSARFSLASNMEYHKNCHIGMKWRCPECGLAADSWHSLSLHLWRQHAVDMELYSCDQCPFKTNSLSKLTNLHKKTHGEERPFLCDHCGKGFKNTKQLRNHKSTHQPKERTPKRELNCPICSRMFADVRMLRHHTDIVHRKLRPFLCSECGHAAASRSSLRMHSRVHTGEKPYQCSDCDYTTNDHNSLRRHKMRHTGAKHYTCPHCPYACIQSTTYMAHLKSKHPGLDKGLMFTCPVCPFKTIKKEIFMTHASSHKEHREEEGNRGSVGGQHRHRQTDNTTGSDVERTTTRNHTTAAEDHAVTQKSDLEKNNHRGANGMTSHRTIVLTVTPDQDFELESVDGELIVPEDIVNR